jgi:hypothetical protein
LQRGSTSRSAIVTPLAGMLAGSCMINWATIIHCRADNNTDSPRRTFWQVFCREGFDLGGRLCGHLSEQYRAAQTIPGTFVTFLLVSVYVSVCLSLSVSLFLSLFVCPPLLFVGCSLTCGVCSGRIASMDDAAQRAAGEGYWRLEDIDSDHKT